jgi:hypothetical protein
VTRSAAARLLLGLVLVLYGSLGMTRTLTEWLRGEGLLLLSVVAAISAALAALLGLLRRQRVSDPVPAAALLLAAPAAALLLSVWQQPEEQLHLAIYLVVGALAWPASGRRLTAALLLAAAIGAGDELLQLLVPSRYFDARDLLANVGVGTATVLLVSGGRRSFLAAPALAGLWLAMQAMGAPAAPSPPAVQVAEIDLQFAQPPPAQETADPTPGPAIVPGEAAAAAAPAPDASAGAPYRGASVVFITVDALRADHLRPWGEPPLPLPAFEQLRASSVSFEHVFANAAWTSPGMLAFLTGLHPSVHGVQERGVNFPAGPVTFLETLSAAGYATWGFAGEAEENYGNLGFQQQLDRTLAPEAMLGRALAAQAGPAFVWLHLRDIHAPYDATVADLEALGLPSTLPDSPILNRARTHYTVPRADFPGRHGWLQEPIRALYAAELANEDKVIGRVLASLDGMEDLIVVVSADHGEELLDHDGIGHASTTLHSAPHPELVRIPLFVRLPDGRGAGQVRAGIFEQIDLVPTLASLLGVAAVEPVAGVPLDGRDLSAALLHGAPADEEHSVLVSTSPCGWQCPEERRGERIHAFIRGRQWWFCDPSAGPCEEPFPTLLSAAAERAQRLRASAAQP